MSNQTKGATTVALEAQRRYGNTRRTVSKLLGFHGISGAELGRNLGLTREVMRQRLSGTSEIKGWERDAIATLLGVPVEVLGMEPNEAVAWAIEHNAQPLIKCLHIGGRPLVGVAA